MNSTATSPAAAAPMLVLDLTTTFGALLIGVIFSSMLYGVTVMQVFLYFQKYPSDGLLVKSAVLSLLVFETLHSAFSVHAIYYYVISNYLNPQALTKSTWTATMTLVSSTMAILVVHLFYLRRIYHISAKNIPLVVVLSVLALAHLAASIVVEVRAFQLKFFVAFAEIAGIVNASLSLAAATDILIATVLSFYLHRRRSGIHSTDTLINKLMMYTINNGILTSVFDIIVLVFVTTEIDNLIFLAIFQVVGNLYTNSMLATLNSRDANKAKRNVHMVQSNGSFPMSSFKVSTGGTGTMAAVGTESKDYPTQGKHEVSIITNTTVV